MIKIQRTISPNQIRKTDKPYHNCLKSCGQEDVASIIIKKCQDIGFWTPIKLDPVWSYTLNKMKSENFIECFGRETYMLTDKAIKLIYDKYN